MLGTILMIVIHRDCEMLILPLQWTEDFNLCM
jgi:hypothetical protein